MLQQLSTFRANTQYIMKLVEAEQKNKAEAYYQVLLPKITFDSHVACNRQKGMLNFLLKSMFSVKPNKFLICFARDCL